MSEIEESFEVMAEASEVELQVRTPDGLQITDTGKGIAKQIINQHSGTIEVESEVDKGTTFTIKFYH